MSQPAIDVPAAVRYGKVIGRFVSFLADSPDAGDVPDQEALQGTVTLTPHSIKVLRFPSTTPPLLAAVRQIECRISSEGDLLPPVGTEPGVWAISSFQPEGQPDYFQWQAKFNFTGLTSTQQPDPVIFEIPDNGVVDISQAIPIDPEPGTVTIVTHEDRLAVEQLYQEILDLIEGGGTGGEGPQGPPGDPGEDGESPQLRLSNGFVQWKLPSSSTWTNLIAVVDITGPKGDKGDKGDPGQDGTSYDPTAFEQLEQAYSTLSQNMNNLGTRVLDLENSSTPSWPILDLPAGAPVPEGTSPNTIITRTA